MLRPLRRGARWHYRLRWHGGAVLGRLVPKSKLGVGFVDWLDARLLGGVASAMTGIVRRVRNETTLGPSASAIRVEGRRTL
jgi:hypothetical protein